ncbi:MAG: peptidase C39 family protein [Micromonosporaceae bacterium]
MGQAGRRRDAPSAPPTSAPRIAYQALPLTSGEHRGTVATAAGVELVTAQGLREYADPYAQPSRSRPYRHATWTAPEYEPGFTFRELVATWHGHTPAGSWLEVCARARSAGVWSGWLVLARWADHDAEVHPTSVPHQANEIARVATDTLRVDAGADAWQLRVTLLRPAPGRAAGPVLTYAGAMVSTATRAPSRLRARSAPGRVTRLRAAPIGPAAGRVLDVPPLSQRVHSGHYPQWGGGGDAWCSPTSTAMVLAYWGTGPDTGATAWVDPGYPDPSVCHAVRHCYDHAYGGAGNWSFNAAYAAGFGLRTFVTRLRDLTEAETFVAAGIPLIASFVVDPDRMAGAEYRSAGHLAVVCGFTRSGDVVVNDPAASDVDSVRRVYRRADFEAAWRQGSAGLVYVMHPPAVPLPVRPAEANW